MQVRVVSGGSPALFNAMLFPEADCDTKSWLQSQWERNTGMLTDIGRQFAERAVETWKSVYDPRLMQKVRAISRKVSGLSHPNTIVPLNTIDAIRGAKPVMARYIMAYPDIRAIYHKQLCDGYSDIYVDHEPNAIGRDHYDYRRVMNHMVEQYEKPNGEQGWRSVSYIEDLHPGDRELETDEKFIILETWDSIHHAIKARLDPTDIFGGKLEA